PTLRLLRLPFSTKKLCPFAPGMIPELIKPRSGSPRTGCSILMTSAPQSASTVPAPGTKNHSATSSIRTPSSTLSMDAPPCVTPEHSYCSDARLAKISPLLASPAGGDGNRGKNPVRRCQHQAAQRGYTIIASAKLGEWVAAQSAACSRSLDQISTPCSSFRAPSPEHRCHTGQPMHHKPPRTART